MDTGSRRSSRIKALLVGLTMVGAVLAAPQVAGATFPGQNGKIAFSRLIPDPQSYCYPQRSQIFVANPDGTGESNISANAYEDFGARWSPTGQQVAFTRRLTVGDCHGNSDVGVMNADGGGQLDVTGATFRADCIYACQELDPVWSPAGDKLAITANANLASHLEGAYEIYTINADGTGPTALGPDGLVSGAPDWSPDSRRITFEASPSIYACQEGWPGQDIYVMNANGSGLVNLTNDLAACNVGPSWAPDGSKILFTRWIGGPVNSQGVFTMNPDGSGVTQLTDVPGDLSPAWSPDGRRIAFRRFSQGIYVMDADGSHVSKVTSAHSDFLWSPDSRKIAFNDLDPTNGSFVIDTVNIDGTELTRVAEGVESVADWQPLPRSAFKNASKYCKAQRDSMGKGAFAQTFGTNGNGANAFGQCVGRGR